MYNFLKADFVHLKSLLSCISWSTMMDIEDLDQCVQCFYDILYSAIDQCVPKIKLRGHKFPPWFDADLISLLKEKEDTPRQHKKFRNPADYETCSQLKPQ